jgi:hypothetical protein
VAQFRIAFSLLVLLSSISFVFAEPSAGFRKTGDRDELVRWSRGDGGIRIFVNLPASWGQRPKRELVIYATPNGSTIEQTL